MKTSTERPGNSVGTAEALNSLHARMERMRLDGAEIIDTALKPKFSCTADSTVCVY